MTHVKTHILPLALFLFALTTANAEISISTVQCICGPNSPGGVTIVATGTAGPFTFQWLISEKGSNNIKMKEATTFARRSEIGTQSRGGLKTLASARF